MPYRLTDRRWTDRETDELMELLDPLYTTIGDEQLLDNIHVSRLNASLTMTSIKRRKRQKFAYRMFACKISRCIHSVYVRRSWHNRPNDDRKFYMRKYNKRIFAVFYI